jgi:hypothetical protein
MPGDLNSEAGLKITDGGTEQKTITAGRIDITAENHEVSGVILD